MRIVIDLQACQSQSAHRGIGRYSLSLVNAMLKINTQHEIFIALSGAFPETIEPLRKHFLALIPEERIVVWHAPFAVSPEQEFIPARIHNASLLREAFLEHLKPDFILITSLFEGFSDNAVTSIGLLENQIPTAVILYDLIPMLYPDTYLTTPEFRNYYNEKIRQLQQANLLLSISESAKSEALTHLHPLPPISVISSAAETHFRKIIYSDTEKADILKQFQLKREFLMYTGGIDPRKNIEGLIEAFAELPQTLLETHQLAIVCAVQPNERHKLVKHMKKHGLTEKQVIITGYVEERILIALYNLCKAFIFPSIHEGFGLPILEAMQCGAPVIGSNRSSLPEAIGHDDALFDPTNKQAITEKIIHVLTDESFRKTLIEHGQHQVTLFSWENTATKTLRALEAAQHTPTIKKISHQSTKPRLAFVSPLPPEQTGIAQYSRTLLPALAHYYEIDVVVAQAKVDDEWIHSHCPIRNVKWFMKHAHEYDRVLYHFGNSTFHTHQFECIKTIPGVVVLHDFYLSGILSHLEMTEKKTCWSEALYHAHGYSALFARHHAPHLDFVRMHYPCNQEVIQSALGIIIHSEESLRLAKQWLNEPHEKPWFNIPLLKEINPLTKIEARRHLNLPENAFITASFGFLAPTKQNLEILKAWTNSSLRTEPNHYLMFVGAAEGAYAESINAYIEQHQLQNQVIITGWIDDHLFDHYLKATDLAIQLRSDSRGETSGAVLSCFSSALPTIVNAHGSMKDLPENTVVKLQDKYTSNELIAALESLTTDSALREKLSTEALAHIQTHHTITQCAAAYFNAIEKSYATPHPAHLIKKSQFTNNETTLLFLESMMINQPPRAIKQLMIDITEWKKLSKQQSQLLHQLIHHPPEGYRIEPIYRRAREPFFRYARSFMSQWLAFPKQGFSDDIISTRRQDVYLSVTSLTEKNRLLTDILKRRGVYLITPESNQTTNADLDAIKVTLKKYFPFYGLDSQPLK